MVKMIAGVNITCQHSRWQKPIYYWRIWHSNWSVCGCAPKNVNLPTCTPVTRAAVIPDLSKDYRFAGSILPNHPLTLDFMRISVKHPRRISFGHFMRCSPATAKLDDEQQRLIKQLQKPQIKFNAQWANKITAQVAAMLGRFVRFAPKGTIGELIGFLDFVP